jgi:hypothetical protein
MASRRGSGADAVVGRRDDRRGLRAYTPGSPLTDRFDDAADSDATASSRCPDFADIAADLLSGDATQRTWGIRSSYDPDQRNEGQAAITRPITVGSATATFAARLATLPITSNAHGSGPPRLPDRDSASNVIDAGVAMGAGESERRRIVAEREGDR